MQSTSWQKVGKWYGQIVGDKGHYYHQKVILPNLMRILRLSASDKVLDLGCGQGILGRQVDPEIAYTGIDLARNLLTEAKRMDTSRKHEYLLGDASKELPIKSTDYSVVTIVLALQNIQHSFKAIQNSAKHLKKGGRLVIVLNHPAFRIPKHSDWGFDEQRRVQYRRMDGYLTPIEIPIESSPFDKEENETTFSYHYPLSAYSEMIFDNGLVIENIEEWISDKKSEGGRAVIENKARREFPLFMAIVARKI